MSCVVGTWRYADIESYLRRTLAEIPGATITSFGGESTLTIQADGSFESRNNMSVNFTANAQGQQVAMYMTFGGYERGTMAEEAPGRLVETITEPAITMTMGPEPAGGPEEITLTLPSAEGIFEYDCAGPTLNVVGTRDGQPVTPMSLLPVR
jgi:hypothetical protein